jgi:hypothetical protein
LIRYTIVIKSINKNCLKLNIPRKKNGEMQFSI